MGHELKSTVTVDHTDGMTRIPSHAYNRQRTVHLRLAAAGRDGYTVQAWGSAFPEDGGGGYQGRVRCPRNAVEDGIAHLRATWQEHVVEHRHTDPATRRTVHPFVDGWDLSAAGACRHGEEVGLRLARAGHDLFRTLFCHDDDGMREITEHLVKALWSGEHAITVQSDEIFVPWGMLYTPAGFDARTYEDDDWSPRGFWGYQHVFEHGFSRTPGFDSRIRVRDGRVRVGLNVDRRVDTEYPPTPYVEPVIDFFAARTRLVVRHTKAELAAALQDRAFPDQITCFGCHAAVSGGDGQAHLVLGDSEKIHAAEVMGWLSARSLPSQPLVFVGACQGGQLASLFYPGFGQHLLAHGARGLLGPQIDLPRAFALAYTTRLFTAFLEPGARLGDLVRDLARSYLDDHGNPFGLAFSLYRGMDIHLWFPPTA